MDAQIRFLRFFFRCRVRTRFRIEILLILGGSEPEKLVFRPDGSMIFTKLTFSKQIRKKLDFGFVFGGQNDKQIMKQLY